jgi:cyclopropane-fatty-acyl-phospholipid synthase
MQLISQQIKAKKRNGLLKNYFRQLLFKQLEKIEHGQLTLTEDHQTYQFGNPGIFNIQLRVHNTHFYQAVILGGSVGAAESYILHEWTCSQLTELIRLFIRNQSLLTQLESGASSIKNLTNKWYHYWRKNTLQLSQRNIHAHYDLGNEFFKLFLDSNLMYSCAIFPSETSTLDTASDFKLKTICEKLNLTSDDHILEIGTGWGGFALYAAKNYGCKVTTTTISQQQYNLAHERIKSAGLDSQITLLQQDYRTLTGQYDKLVSIEMLEAVGHQYYPIYFSTCDRLLKPHGKMLLQTITIADQYYEQAKRSVDFIQRFIFPGGCIPSPTALLHAMTTHSNLRLVGMEDIGLHYATTLQQWRDRFLNAQADVKKLGYGDEFIRLWNYYLCYCEGGFLEQHLSNMHLLLLKGT